MTASTKPAFWPAIAKGVMPTVEHLHALRSLSIATLIDVGANKGQFSIMARYLFPAIDICAFEPLESERSRYRTVVKDPVTLHSTALGRVPGEATFFVASRADSSSLLKPGARQEAAYGVTTRKSIKVPVARLADAIDVSRLRRPTLLKLDVQGGELDVLLGAEPSLSQIDIVYCELSFIELYSGQPLAGSVAAYLATHGFSLRGVFNQSMTRDFGPTQADFLFTLDSADHTAQATGP
jgi:FkbM family methyltransferase